MVQGDVGRKGVALGFSGGWVCHSEWLWVVGWVGNFGVCSGVV